MQPAVDPAQLPLRDIHLPAPPSWWPPAPGWWLLGALLVCVPLAVALGLHLRRRGALRRRALRELATLRESAAPPAHVAAEVALLIRRVSRAFDPARHHVAATGPAWLARVRAIAPGFDAPELGETLLRAPYATRVEADAAALLGALERWIRALPTSARRRRELAAPTVGAVADV